VTNTNLVTRNRVLDANISITLEVRSIKGTAQVVPGLNSFFKICIDEKKNFSKRYTTGMLISTRLIFTQMLYPESNRGHSGVSFHTQNEVEGGSWIILFKE